MGKAALFAASLVPFGWLVYAALTDQLGANPAEYLTRSTGDWALLDSLLELGCDVLALAQPGTDGVGESQSVACIAGGELRVGALGLSPD